MAEQTVKIDSSTPISVTGSVTTTQAGSVVADTTLSAATTGTGTVIDYGRAQNDITMAIIANGTVTGGVVALDTSMDGTNWILVATDNPATGVNAKLSVTGEAWRYARGRISTNITGGGSVTCTLMTGG